MNIADLFVSIGVKGDGSAKKALEGTQKGLGEIKSMSLEAKAAIIAVVYGLERLMSASAKRGTDLENFAYLTGQSTKELQKWQYAGQQVGISADEMAGAFSGAFKTLSQLDLGLGVPKGLGQIIQSTGLDLERSKKDTAYFFSKLREYIKKEGNKGIANEWLSPFLSPVMQAGFRNPRFDPSKTPGWAINSEGQIKALAVVGAAWKNFFTRIDRSFDQLNAKFGPEIVKNLNKILSELMPLITEFIKFTQSLGAFDTLLSALKGIADALKEINAMIKEFKGESKPKSMEDREKLIKESLPGSFVKGLFNAVGVPFLEGAVPGVKPSSNERSPQSVNQTNNINVHGVESPVETGQEVQKSINYALRQMSAQVEVA